MLPIGLTINDGKTLVLQNNVHHKSVFISFFNTPSWFTYYYLISANLRTNSCKTQPKVYTKSSIKQFGVELWLNLMNYCVYLRKQ